MCQEHDDATQVDDDEEEFERGVSLGKHAAEMAAKKREEEFEQGFNLGKQASREAEEHYIEANTEKVEFETFDFDEMMYVLQNQHDLSSDEFDEFIE